MCRSSATVGPDLSPGSSSQNQILNKLGRRYSFDSRGQETSRTSTKVDSRALENTRTSLELSTKHYYFLSVDSRGLETSKLFFKLDSGTQDLDQG